MHRRLLKKTAAEVEAALPETARSKPLEIWFQDEARVGQQGTLTADKENPSVEHAPVPRGHPLYLGADYANGLKSCHMRHAGARISPRLKPGAHMPFSFMWRWLARFGKLEVPGQTPALFP